MFIQKENSETENFGEHLIIDGYQADPVRLNDKDNVRDSIELLPPILGMEIVSEAKVCASLGSNLKDPSGWTAFVVTPESHISAHTFPETRFVSIDVYTCRSGLDTAAIANWFGEYFGIKVFELKLIHRGTRLPELRDR